MKHLRDGLLQLLVLFAGCVCAQSSDLGRRIGPLPGRLMSGDSRSTGGETVNYHPVNE